MPTVADVLERTPVTELDLSRHVTVGPVTSVRETVASMNERGVSCAVILDSGSRPLGIFTQRDVLSVGSGDCTAPVEEKMSTPVETVRDTQTAADALHIMNELWVRSVPVVDAAGVFIGNLSYYPLMRRIHGLLQERALQTGNEVSARHGMAFIDFTGLQFHQPVTVTGANTVADAVYQMTSHGIGSVVVVDDRNHVTGMFTEFDHQMRVACSNVDPESTAVSAVMTDGPVTLTVRSSLLDGLGVMAEHGFSHLPLVGESGRLVGVVSFRDLADYFETTLAVLA